MLVTFKRSILNNSAKEVVLNHYINYHSTQIINFFLLGWRLHKRVCFCIIYRTTRTFPAFLFLFCRVQAHFYLILYVTFLQWPVRRTERYNKGADCYSTRWDIRIRQVWWSKQGLSLGRFALHMPVCDALTNWATNSLNRNQTESVF